MAPTRRGTVWLTLLLFKQQIIYFENFSPSQVIAGIWDPKLLLVIAVYQNQIIAYEFLRQGETMDADRYIRFLNETLRGAIEREGIRQPIILQDNARPHTSVLTQAYLFEETDWELLNHPPYSPDMNPCDFDVINKIKNPLRGNAFDDLDELRNSTIASMMGLNENQTLIGTTELVGRWQKVVDTNGAYIN